MKKTLVMEIYRFATQMKQVVHCGMRDDHTPFNSARRENPSKYTVLSVEFNGIIRIICFRQAVTLKI